jgi:hypothetical protein
LRAHARVQTRMPTAPNCHTVCASSGVRPRAPVETQLMRGTAVARERSPEHSLGSEARKSTHPLPADPSRGAELHRRLWRCGTSRLDVRTSVPARHRDSSRSALLATTDVPSQPSFRGCGKRGEALRCLAGPMYGRGSEGSSRCAGWLFRCGPPGHGDLGDVDRGQLP